MIVATFFGHRVFAATTTMQQNDVVIFNSETKSKAMNLDVLEKLEA